MVAILAGTGGGIALLVCVLVSWKKIRQQEGKVAPQYLVGSRTDRAPVEGLEDDVEDVANQDNISSDAHSDALPSNHQAMPQQSASVLFGRWKLNAEDVKLYERIGLGAQADVWRASWRGQPVAVKELRSSGRAAELEKFLHREVRALSRVQHCNVVRLYGVCDAIGTSRAPCVIMSLAARNLEQELREPTLDEPSTLRNVRILRGVANGMAAVHAQKISHLDLKPENVLLSTNGEPWITDFGLSASLATSGSTVADGRGSLAYKAPELFRTRASGSALVGYAADIYSFAVLAWQVLTRVQPWSDLRSPHTEIPESVKAGERPEIAGTIGWREYVSAPALVDLVEAAWAQEPEDRPCFRELANRLEEAEVEAIRVEMAKNEEARKAEIKEAERRAEVAERERERVHRQLAEFVNVMESEKAKLEGAVNTANTDLRSVQQQLAACQAEVDGLRTATECMDEEIRAAQRCKKELLVIDNKATERAAEVFAGERELLETSQAAKREQRENAREALAKRRQLLGKERSALDVERSKLARLPPLAAGKPQGTASTSDPSSNSEITIC